MFRRVLTAAAGALALGALGAATGLAIGVVILPLVGGAA